MQRSFYYRRPGDTAKSGPVEESRFMEMTLAGQVAPDTMVWCTGMREWTTWANFRSAQPPPLPTKAKKQGISSEVERVHCSVCSALRPVTFITNAGSKPICYDCFRAMGDEKKSDLIQEARNGSPGGAGILVKILVTLFLLALAFYSAKFVLGFIMQFL